MPALRLLLLVVVAVALAAPAGVATAASKRKPALTVRSSRAVEGQPHRFLVALNRPSRRRISARVTIHPLTTEPADHARTTARLRIPRGRTAGVLEIPITADETYEDTERFAVEITRLRGARGAKLDATGTIVDDDARPSAVVESARVPEDAGVAVMTARLSGPSERPVTFGYRVGSVGRGGQDVLAAQGSVTFAPGVVAVPLSVRIVADAIDEDDQDVPVSGWTADDVRPGGVLTIVDDDPEPTISVGDVLLAYEQTAPARFPILLSHPSEKTVEITATTEDGTAEGGSCLSGYDFEPTRIEWIGLRALGGFRSAPTIGVSICGGLWPGAKFALRVTGARNAVLGDAVGEATRAPAP